MRMHVECDRCTHRFIMRCPEGAAGLVRVSCPHCNETIVLLVHAPQAAIQ